MVFTKAMNLNYYIDLQNNIRIIANISENDNSNTVILRCQNITGVDGYYFSIPILNSSSVLAVRKDSKRNTLPPCCFEWKLYNKRK